MYDAVWRDLSSDRDRITFGDSDAAKVPRHLQRALALLNQPQAALEVAEHAKARSLDDRSAILESVAPSQVAVPWRRSVRFRANYCPTPYAI